MNYQNRFTKTILIILITILLISLISFISGCAQKECRRDSQCNQLSCHTAACVENTCVYTAIPDCCGNNKCELSETRCTCSVDCQPACVGDVILEKTLYKNVTSDYLKYVCNDEQMCEVQVKQELQKPVTVVDLRKMPKLTLDMELFYNQPFDIVNDKMKVTVRLKDVDKRIKLPVVIKKIQVISGQELMGSRNINEKLTSVDAYTTIEMPVTAEIDGRQDERQVRVKIEYDIQEFKTDNDINQIRDTIEKTFSDKIMFVETGVDE